MAGKEIKSQMLVIGGGPGGYAAAFMAADLGLEVTLVDPEKNPGGVCLYRGCIPTKALLHAAKVKQEALHASDFGFSFKEPDVDPDKLREWKDKIVSKLTGGIGQLAKQRKLKHIQGKARFESSTKAVITSGEQEGTVITFEKAILASGSVPASLPGIETDGKRIITSKEALDIKQVPKKLLIVGAGYIGLEMATIYGALGSEITLVEMTDSFLPGQDRDLVSVFEKANKNLFKKVLFETKLKKAEVSGKKVKTIFENKDGEQKGTFDQVLVAVGRKPRTEGTGLENTKVETDGKGFVKVDDQRKTTDDHIYAIGDITGNPMLAHKASHEGIVAAEAIAGKRTAFEPNAIPAVVFTSPEMAWCGLTENEAKEKGIEVKVAKFPWGASGRATTLNYSPGLTKLIIDPETDRILGAAIVGDQAGELIGEATFAVEMAALASDLQLTIHAHPTLSETLMEAAASYYGLATHIYRPKRK